MYLPLKFDLLKVGHCHHLECIASGGGRLQSVRFPALCGLIHHPQHGYILFDTGYGDHFHTATRRFPERLYSMVTPMALPGEETLLQQLNDRGVSSDQIAWIIISHFHGDHIAGLKDFKNAHFIASGKEYASIKKSGRFSRLRKGFLLDLIPDDFETRVRFSEEIKEVSLEPSLAPFLSGLDLFGDGTILGIPLPGHTEGQLGILFSEERGQLLFLVGDACWGIPALEKNRKPTILARQIFASAKDYGKTFERLRELHKKEVGPKIIPSHCDVTWTDSCSS